VPYFAAALARTGSSWTAQELDLDDVDDLDTLADLLREVDDEAELALLLLEEDDEYFAVVRVDGAGDARVFVSDARAAGSSGLAAMLTADIDPPEPEDASDEEGASARPDVEPVGDTDLLTDLGTSPQRLLDLSATEGILPADAITAVCERAGCVDQLEELRES